MTFTIALPSDEGFQKYLARKVILENELVISVADGEWTGFVTGLDADWVQLTTTNGQHAVLVNLVNVTSIRETGRRAHQLPGPVAEKVRGYAFAIKKMSEQAMAVSKRDSPPSSK